MKINTFKKTLLPLAISLALGPGAVSAAVLVQCPGDLNADAIPDRCLNGINTSGPNAGLCRVSNVEIDNPDYDPNVRCMHLSAGDSFTTMGDASRRYIFSYADITGKPTITNTAKQLAIQAGMLAHEWPAPTIVLEEGQEFYLSLTNVGMLMRPDLFDPHTVHFHGFPQASTVFDGVPDSSISIGMGATLTYYYKINDPGTYMYHCHVEATEHMQMGMLGNLYVKPAQDGASHEYPPGSGNTYTQFAYNDGDGSTGYDIDYPIQLASFDGVFHDASESTQPLPFALMKDDYAMINGRGYPDTVDPRTDGTESIYDPTGTVLEPFPPADGFNNIYVPTGQPVSSLIIADPGDRVLLRLSNLSITRFYTLQSLGLTMNVVGKDAKLLRSSAGDLYYGANSVTVGPGGSYDVILEVPSTAAGQTFYLFTSNLNYLSNGAEEFGGMMTEIHIN